jgi:hypothetical protein
VLRFCDSPDSSIWDAQTVYSQVSRRPKAAGSWVIQTAQSSVRYRPFARERHGLATVPLSPCCRLAALTTQESDTTGAPSFNQNLSQDSARLQQGPVACSCCVLSTRDRRSGAPRRQAHMTIGINTQLAKGTTEKCLA